MPKVVTNLKSINMKNKTLIFQILSAVLTFALAYQGAVSAQTAMILGIAIAVISPVLKTFFPSGTLISGWSNALWISNGAMVFLQILNSIQGYGLISPELLNMITIGLNTIILLASQKQL